MSQSKTKKYKILISIPASELLSNNGLDNNPIDILKKIIATEAPSHEVITDNIAEFVIIAHKLKEQQIVDIKEKVIAKLKDLGYSENCLTILPEEEMDKVVPSNVGWEGLMEYALHGEVKPQEHEVVKPPLIAEDVTEEDIDAMFAELEAKLAQMDAEKEAEEKKTQEEEDNAPQTLHALEEIEGLQGAEAFKKYARALVDGAKNFRKYQTQEYVMQRSLLFVVEDGDGFSTYLNLLAKHMKELRILPSNDFKDSNEVSNVPFDDAWIRIVGKSCRKVNLVGLDLSQMLDKLATKEFQDFLRMVSESAKPTWIVFRIPAMDELSKKKIQDQLSTFFTVEAIDIPVMSLEQYTLFAKQYAKGLGYEVEQDATELLQQSIYQEKLDQKFYGFKTVMKVMEDMIYQKNLAESTGGSGGEMNLTITAEDVKRVLKKYEEVENADSLDDLIGIESIRERLDEIVAQILLNKSLGKSNTSSLHMRFVGNPGTGKTTVARLLGKLLKEKGVLSKGQFFEYKGRDLVGRYIGETTPKTAGICRDAYGSVLFIDEAYTLYKGADNDRDYGPEALAELITHMENHREDFMVIMAGYTDDMAKLMEGNLGLESRMPYEIMFEDYNQDQLYEIFLSMGRKDYIYTDGLKKVAKEYFANIPVEVIKQKGFANARFVRNLFERTVAKGALRLQMEPQKLQDGKVVLIEGDFAKASNDREFQKLQEKKKPTIGFY